MLKPIDLLDAVVAVEHVIELVEVYQVGPFQLKDEVYFHST